MTAGMTAAERIARLEVIADQLEKDMQENTEQTKSLHAKIDLLTEAITKYKGFLGGIAFFGSCIVAFFKLIPVLGPYLSAIGQAKH